MKNKKGISAIVATVLIILITVAAVTIIWAAIIPMINNQLSKGTVCLDAASQVSLSDVGYTCKDVTGDTVSLQVKRGSLDIDLDDIQVIIGDIDGNSRSYSVKDGTSFTQGGGQLPGANEERVYVIDTSGIAAETEKVQIAPVVQIGRDTEACEVSATRTLSVCA